jgi:predicted Rossmann fold flavoprotein
VPLIFREPDRKLWGDLAGVSTDVVASVGGNRQIFREKMLFTHRGLSGPAILQISSYWNGQAPIALDLAPNRNLREELRVCGRRDAAAWKSLLREILPRRLADRWLEIYPLVSNSDRAFTEAERQIHDWRIWPKDTEGFAKAEVTAGGVDTSELFAQTMECRNIPGLFLVGEVVDVTGQLGGFNFQWAWASGFCAGRAL